MGMWLGLRDTVLVRWEGWIQDYAAVAFKELGSEP